MENNVAAAAETLMKGENVNGVVFTDNQGLALWSSGTGSSASAGSIISLVETAKELSGDDELVGVSVATDYTCAFPHLNVLFLPLPSGPFPFDKKKTLLSPFSRRHKCYERYERKTVALFLRHWE